MILLIRILDKMVGSDNPRFINILSLQLLFPKNIFVIHYNNHYYRN